MNKLHLFKCLAGPILVLIISCTNGKYTSWEYDKSINNIEFAKIRYGIIGNDTTAIIGYLKFNTNIQGYPCKADWVHFNRDWKLTLFRLAEETTIQNFKFPVDSWIRPGIDNLVCSFPDDIVIQGYLCRGSGGPKGVQTSFYRGGQLQSFYTNGKLKVGEISCKSNPFNNIILFENASLKEGTLSENQTIKGVSYKKGARISIASDGKIIEKN